MYSLTVMINQREKCNWIWSHLNWSYVYLNDFGYTKYIQKVLITYDVLITNYYGINGLCIWTNEFLEGQVCYTKYCPVINSIVIGLTQWPSFHKYFFSLTWDVSRGIFIALTINFKCQYIYIYISYVWYFLVSCCLSLLHLYLT